MNFVFRFRSALCKFSQQTNPALLRSVDGAIRNFVCNHYRVAFRIFSGGQCGNEVICRAPAPKVSNSGNINKRIVVS